MSKPNLLGFSSSLGIYRNKRMRDLRGILLKEVPVKVPFAELSTTLFQALMAYAGENQIDGDFTDYKFQDFVEIFSSNNIPVSLSQATAIRKAFDSVGLLEDGKIRSWAKFNRHFAEHEVIVRRKRKAAKEMHKRREQEARSRHVDPSKNGEDPAPKPVQKAAQKDSPSKHLWVLDAAIKEARGSKKRELLKQRQELLSETTGVDLSPPPPSPAPAPGKPPRKLTAAEHEREILDMAKSTLQDFPEGLSENMVTALVRAGHKLPAAVKTRFRDLVAKLQADNPVPE